MTTSASALNGAINQDNMPQPNSGGNGGMAKPAASSSRGVANSTETTPLLQRSGEAIGSPATQNAAASATTPAPTAQTSHVAAQQTRKAPTYWEMFLAVLPFIKPRDTKHVLLVTVSLIAVLVGKVISILPPLAIRWAVDVISSTTADIRERARAPIFAIAAFFGLQVLSSALGIIENLSHEAVSIDANQRLSRTAYAHLHKLTLSYHLERNVGEVSSMLSRGTSTVSTFIDVILFTLAPTLFETVLVLGVFWKLGTPAIALSTLAAVTCDLLFTAYFTKVTVKFRRRMYKAYDALFRHEVESLVNFETVKIFGRGQAAVDRYVELQDDNRTGQIEMDAASSMLGFGHRTIRLLGVCSGLILAARATVHGNPPLSPGSFVVIQLYIGQLFSPLMRLTRTYKRLFKSFTDLEKLIAMMTTAPDVEDSPAAVVWKPERDDQSSPSGDVLFEKVSFHYSPRKPKKKFIWYDSSDDEGEETPTKNEDVGDGISRVTFRVPAGKTAAVVGRSGSGKSTIVRLILRLYDAAEGTISVSGRNVRAYTQESLRSNIGVVAQDTVLFNATLRENIAYGKPDATDTEVWEAVRAAALEEFVKKQPDKLCAMVGERGMKLSGGERQRVGLARCVIKNPQLLLLDEATSSLDSRTEREIQDNIAQICKGKTTLMIAHRLSTIRFADEIIVLDEGEICEKGTHDELIAAAGNYAQMWKDQTEAGAFGSKY